MNEATNWISSYQNTLKKSLLRRNIPRDLLDKVLQQPEQIVPQYGLEKVYQSRITFGSDGIFLVRVIVDDSVTPTVVTVYRTSKIKKYWREP